MFTSRAEHRLLLREDNADQRLSPIAKKLGLINDERWVNFNRKLEDIEKEKERLKNFKLSPYQINKLHEKSKAKRQTGVSAFELLKRPEITYEGLCEILNISPEKSEIALDVTTNQKYSGYIQRQKKEIKKVKKNENALIPEQIDFNQIEGLSNESKQKLSLVKPKTLAHAQRIPGLTPAAISLLLVHIKKKSLQKDNVV